MSVSAGPWVERREQQLLSAEIRIVRWRCGWTVGTECKMRMLGQ